MPYGSEARIGKKRGHYTLHKVNPNSFKKGMIPKNKGTGKPIQGDKECPICHTIFHWEIKAYKKPNGYFTYVGREPKTCSNKCRYKSASLSQKGKESWLKMKNWEHRAKKNANMTIERLVNKGLLLKKPCEVCGNPKSEAHHYLGYDKIHWLDIKWLCHKHHYQDHSQMKK